MLRFVIQDPAPFVRIVVAFAILERLVTNIGVVGLFCLHNILLADEIPGAATACTDKA